ncbi:unnamed protein product [Adineta steineri]|uniref:G-protein coupled receptors family 1 profile domain-containing protein n=1 Tax=Adineta steineri TaxID=433720 RepID=A0A819QEG8_9BILA|nr:unnamed protein product [Adineta steineri]CAF1406046.1 unnamed protein product [Adineta steineri]CAF1445623.1 unnamed protein product [Adineta steineri]CAF3707689.1 unnamed protein product [Adineta steineri]CAF4030048.1 unnamed protein product [Adineta steineri]
MASNETFPQIAYPIRVIIPIVYTLITAFALIGNILNFYSLCVSRDRYGRKSIHVLIWNLIIEGTIWSSIFYIVKMVSYADLGEHFALNNGKWLNDSWCKSELYILRIMDFLLAYTIVFLCFDRCVKRKQCCYGIRRFITGICILVSLWLAVCYALIPILFFNQQLISFNYGSYECMTNETQINELTWLDLQNVQSPIKTIYLLDFIFGNALPIFLMILLLVIRYFIYRKAKKDKYKNNMNTNLTELDINTYKNFDLRTYDDEHPNLIKMVVLYVIIFIICQLPYYIYRLVRIYHPSIYLNLSSMNILYAIDIPLIILRLINRAINPWLSFFLMRSIRDSSRQACTTFWCCGCFPCCPNRWSCLRDCSVYIRNEWYDLTANHQLMREIRPTGNTMKKEFIDPTGKRIRQIYEEYVRYYHRPRTHFSDANPALLFAGKNTLVGNENLSYLSSSNPRSQHSQILEPSTEL